MKPFLAAALILGALFVAGAMNCRAVAAWSDTIGSDLTLSCQAAAQENWEEADAALQRADQVWQSHSAYLHVMVNHSEIDEAETLFAEAKEYAAQQDSGHYRVSAAQLRAQLSHLSETQQLKLKNIL